MPTFQLFGEKNIQLKVTRTSLKILQVCSAPDIYLFDQSKHGQGADGFGVVDGFFFIIKAGTQEPDPPAIQRDISDKQTLNFCY